jgi:tetratricopeptide (TPR) repeat protein
MFDTLFQQAKEAFEQGAYQKAADLFMKASELQPSSSTECMNYVDLCFAAMPTEAERPSSVTTPMEFIDRCHTLASKETNYNLACTHYEKALEHDKSSFTAEMLGRLHMRHFMVSILADEATRRSIDFAGLYSKAITCLSSCININPVPMIDLGTTNLIYAQFLRDSSDSNNPVHTARIEDIYQQAFSWYQKASSACEGSVLQQEINKKIGVWTQLYAAFKTWAPNTFAQHLLVLETLPLDTAAGQFLHEGNYEAAKSMFQSMLAITSYGSASFTAHQHCHASAGLCRVYLKQGHWEEAQAALLRAKEIESKFHIRTGQLEQLDEDLATQLSIQKTPSFASSPDAFFNNPGSADTAMDDAPTVVI